jgi:hypothetical protein
MVAILLLFMELKVHTNLINLETSKKYIFAELLNNLKEFILQKIDENEN